MANNDKFTHIFTRTLRGDIDWRSHLYKIKQFQHILIQHIDAAMRAGLRDVRHLPREQLLRHLGLGDVVNARAAAAPHGLRQFHELQAGDELEQLARLPRDLLPVAKVAGLVISDPEG